MARNPHQATAGVAWAPNNVLQLLHSDSCCSTSIKIVYTQPKKVLHVLILCSCDKSIDEASGDVAKQPLRNAEVATAFVHGTAQISSPLQCSRIARNDVGVIQCVSYGEKARLDHDPSERAVPRNCWNLQQSQAVQAHRTSSEPQHVEAEAGRQWREQL